MPLYPFLLEPIYKEKVWGGRALERFGRDLPGGPDVGVGESWELADLDATSPSGGGGEAARTRIRNGPLIERTVGEVVDDFGSLVTGDADLGASGRLPLLIKYLDARENLSVQVHPSSEYAARHPGAHLKSEAWYVVDAEPDAVIYKGLAEGTTRSVLESALGEGAVPDLLVRVPARPGECHYLPSGTCHALGAGILVAEVQTPSDTTFRLYDWDRSDRELHMDQALACIDFGPVDSEAYEPGTTNGVDDAVVRDLVACEHFGLREWTVLREGGLVSDVDQMRVLMLIEGRAVLDWGKAQAGILRVGPGDSVLLPAALERTEIRALSDLKLLEVSLPSADVDRAPTRLPVVPGPT